PLSAGGLCYPILPPPTTHRAAVPKLSRIWGGGPPGTVLPSASPPAGIAPPPSEDGSPRSRPRAWAAAGARRADPPRDACACPAGRSGGCYGRFPTHSGSPVHSGGRPTLALASPSASW